VSLARQEGDRPGEGEEEGAIHPPRNVPTPSDVAHRLRWGVIRRIGPRRDLPPTQAEHSEQHNGQQRFSPFRSRLDRRPRQGLPGAGPKRARRSAGRGDPGGEPTQYQDPYSGQNDNRRDLWDLPVRLGLDNVAVTFRSDPRGPLVRPVEKGSLHMGVSISLLL
jgi:hypothetical protein